MSNILKISAVKTTKEQLFQWTVLRRQLENECEIDEECLVDTLEGETDLFEALLAVADEISERETMAEAIGLHMKTLQERKSRIEKTAETLRNIILQSMDIAGIPKIPGVHATLSVNERQPDVLIDDESLIPAKFWKTKDPEIDKKAINAAAKDGEVIPGTSRSNGKISLTIRRK